MTGEPLHEIAVGCPGRARAGASATGLSGRWLTPPKPDATAIPEAAPTALGRDFIDLFLADGKRLSDYSIGPNSKLNLVVKPLEKVLVEESATQKVAEAPPLRPPAWQLIAKVLARHFSAADANRVLDQLQRVRRVAPDVLSCPSCSHLPLAWCTPMGTPPESPWPSLLRITRSP